MYIERSRSHRSYEADTAGSMVCSTFFLDSASLLLLVADGIYR